MTTNSESRDSTLFALTMAIERLNFVKEISAIMSASSISSSVGVILTVVKVRLLPLCSATSPRLIFNQDFMVNEGNYVSLGLNCAEICQALNQGTNGKRLEDLNESAREAIKQSMA